MSFPEQSPKMSTEEKFAALRASDLASTDDGAASHEIWTSFTYEERKLWWENKASVPMPPGDIPDGRNAE